MNTINKVQAKIDEAYQSNLSNENCEVVGLSLLFDGKSLGISYAGEYEKVFEMLFNFLNNNEDFMNMFHNASLAASEYTGRPLEYIQRTSVQTNQFGEGGIA